jgi:hypothetical protein
MYNELIVNLKLILNHILNVDNINHLIWSHSLIYKLAISSEIIYGFFTATILFFCSRDCRFLSELRITSVLVERSSI